MDMTSFGSNWESTVAAACLPKSARIWCIREDCFQRSAEICVHWTDIGNYVAALAFHKSQATQQQVLHSLASLLSVVVPLLSSATYTADYSASALIGGTKVCFNQRDVNLLHVLLFHKLSKVTQYLSPNPNCIADPCCLADTNENVPSQLEFICDCLRCCIRMIPMMECFDTSASQSASDTLDDIFQSICSPENISSLSGCSQTISIGNHDFLKPAEMHSVQLQFSCRTYKPSGFDHLQTRVLLMIRILEVCMDELLLHPQFTSLLFKKKTNRDFSLSCDSSDELLVEAAFVHGLLSDLLKRSSRSIPWRDSTKLSFPACVLLMDMINAYKVPRRFLIHIMTLVGASLGKSSVSLSTASQLLLREGLELSWCSFDSATEDREECRCLEDLPSGVVFGLAFSVVESSVKLILEDLKPDLMERPESLGVLPSTSQHIFLVEDINKMVLPFKPLLRYFEYPCDEVERLDSHTFINSLLHLLDCTLMRTTNEIMKISSPKRLASDVQAAVVESQCGSGKAAPDMYADAGKALTRHCHFISTLLKGTTQHLASILHPLKQYQLIPKSFSILESVTNFLSLKCASDCKIFHQFPQEIFVAPSQEHDEEPSNPSQTLQIKKSDPEPITLACQKHETNDALTGPETSEASKDEKEGRFEDKKTKSDVTALSYQESIKQIHASSFTIVKRLLRTRHQTVCQNATNNESFSSDFERLPTKSTKQKKSRRKSAARPLFGEMEGGNGSYTQNLCSINPYFKELLTIERTNAEAFDDLKDFVVCKEGRNYSKFMKVRLKYRRMLHSRTIWKRMQEKRDLLRLLGLPNM